MKKTHETPAKFDTRPSLLLKSHVVYDMRKAVVSEREKERAAETSPLLGGRRVLGDSLGAFRDGVLGKLTREDQPHGSLDLAGGDGGLLVVGSELGGLSGDALEDVCWNESENVGPKKGTE